MWENATPQRYNRSNRSLVLFGLKYKFKINLFEHKPLFSHLSILSTLFVKLKKFEFIYTSQKNNNHLL